MCESIVSDGGEGVYAALRSREKPVEVNHRRKGRFRAAADKKGEKRESGLKYNWAFFAGLSRFLLETRGKAQSPTSSLGSSHFLAA